MFTITPCSSEENAFFDIERALQTRVFCSFTEKGSGHDPQDPPSCTPELHMSCTNFAFMLVFSRNLTQVKVFILAQIVVLNVSSKFLDITSQIAVKAKYEPSKLLASFGTTIVALIKKTFSCRP